MLNMLGDSGWQVEGIEPNVAAAEYACKEFGLKI